MDRIIAFVNDPLVAPLYALLVVALADFALGVWLSIRAGAFDWQKLPDVLGSTVLDLVIPLAALGVAAFLVTDSTLKSSLLAAYVGGCGVAVAKEIAAFIGKVTGNYTPTSKAMDRRVPGPTKR